MIAPYFEKFILKQSGHDGDSYVPKSTTLFQVKKPKMPPASIKIEMSPNGDVRQSIQNPIKVNGAYIIVSSLDSLAEKAISNRRNAMKEELAKCKDGTKVKIDYYDSDRVANWVRSYPSLILWVKSKIGRSYTGWKSYDNWANCPNGIDEKFLFDESTKVYDTSLKEKSGESVVAGINRIRKKYYLEQVRQSE